jgi:hypothetical protein
MDEAGMTDRAAMVAVARLCEQAGAKLVLVGDHEQLESPEARGAMRLMARVAETFELGQVHRFACDWERDASLRLRAGDVEVLDEYAAHGRIYGGTAEANERRAVRLALADHLSGGRVFILAGTNERAARVAGLFRPGWSRTAWSSLAACASATATWPGSGTGSCAGATTGRSPPAGEVS